MRQKLAQEIHRNIETAVQPAIQSLLHQRIEVVKKEAELLERENEIDRREHMSLQLEEFLTAGQRQLFLAREFDDREVRTIEPTQIVFARAEGEAEAVHKFRKMESDLKVRKKELHIREANLATRETTYKVLVREEVKAELLAELEQELDARVSEARAEVKREFAGRVDEAAYQRGFAAGKTEGLITDHTGDDEGFIIGHKQCLRMAFALQKLSKILGDGHELDFLTDLEHLDNPYNVGLKVGRLDAGNKGVERK